MFSKGFLKTSLLAGLLQIASTTATGLAPLEERQLNACPTGSNITQVVLTNVVHQFPVFINTFIQQNTILNINNIAITINNAPTQLVTSFIGTSTSVSTSTVTTTTTATPATTFIVQVGPTTAPVAKRQSSNGQYIGANGAVTPDCASASLFVFQNGAITNPAGAPVAVNGSIGPFAPSMQVGAVATQFTLVNTAGRVQIFAAGSSIASSFCEESSGVVNIVSGGAAPPAQCLATTLFALNVAFCVNGPTTTSSSSSTSATTTTSTSTGTTTTGTPSPTPNCANVPGSVLDITQGVCVCTAGLTPVVDVNNLLTQCACPNPGASLNLAGTLCICPVGSTFDQVQRACVCPSGATPQTNPNTPNLALTGCPCLGGSTLNTQTNACECPTGAQATALLGPITACACLAGTLNTASNACECPAGATPTLDVNGLLTLCTCPGTSQLLNGSCQCPNGTPVTVGGIITGCQ